ncbi:MAG: endonuclease/exonuclease/phosphatase family protein [Acidimicrobiia bacterium]|nr:endonuclease/exonuclease/phosphatase family protein [Acidimicrobiia bacterium]
MQLNAASLLEPHWEERRVELVAGLDELDPDVVCLQETWEDATHPNTMAWVVEHAARPWHRASVGRPQPPDAWPDPDMRFGPTVLSRWPIEESALIELPHADDADLAAGYRMRMSALHVRTNGIDVFTAHLAPPPSQGALRVQQVLHLEDEVRRRSAPDAVLPPILTGDFNTEPGADEVRYLSGLTTFDGRGTYWQDAWLAAGNTEPGWTWHGARNPLADRMHLPPKRIDFVFVGDPFGRSRGAGLVESCRLAFDEPRTGILASDHFGLVVDIRWPQRTAEA